MFLSLEILANSLRRTFGTAIGFTVPPGGVALWVHFQMSTDNDGWAQRSLQRGVPWHPGRRYAFDGQSKPYAGLSFAPLNERELPEGVRRMASAARR